MKKFLVLTAAALLGAAVLSAQPRILAHRGGRAEQEENTLDAFKATYAAGCTGYETDIHITADGQYVIMHDHTLERMTDGEGRIEQCQSTYIRTLKTKGGRPVLFLDELLDFIKGCKPGLYFEFEMKTNQEDYSDALIRKYCEDVYAKVTAVKKEGDLFLFTSFDPRPILYLKEHHPDADLMLLFGRPLSREIVDMVKSLGLSRVAAVIDGTPRNVVKYAHERGLIVSLWPGLAVEDTHLGYLLGSDFLCTDIPQEVMRYIDEHHLPIRY